MSKRVCLVTGGGRGIGAAVAREMHARDYELVLMSPSENCETLAEELGGVARRGVAQSEADLKAIVDLAMTTHGRVDAVLNHTGHPPKGDLLAITDENWDLAHDMILKSVIRMARLVTPVMEAEGQDQSSTAPPMPRWIPHSGSRPPAPIVRRCRHLPNSTPTATVPRASG